MLVIDEFIVINFWPQQRTIIIIMHEKKYTASESARRQFFMLDVILKRSTRLETGKNRASLTFL